MFFILKPGVLSTGALWRSQETWRSPFPWASSRSSRPTRPPPSSPSNWRTPAGWSRSSPTCSYSTGEDPPDLDWTRQRREIQLSPEHKAVARLSEQTLTGSCSAARVSSEGNDTSFNCCFIQHRTHPTLYCISHLVCWSTRCWMCVLPHTQPCFQ